MYADEKIDDYVKRFGKILGRNYSYHILADGYSIWEIITQDDGTIIHKEVIATVTESELRLWVRLQCVRIRNELRGLI